MDNNYNNDQNYSGAPNSGAAPEPQYGSQHSFTGSSAEQYGTQSAGAYDPQHNAPDYGGSMYGGYPQQSGPNYGGQPVNGYGQPYPAPDFYTQMNDPYAAPPPDSTGGKAVASLVMGIISFLTWCIPVMGSCVSLIGLILGLQSRKGSSKGMAIAGIALSSITLAVSLVINVLFVVRIVGEMSTV